MNPAEIRAVLAHWPLIAAGAEFASATPGFSGASVQRIATAAGDFALRCWPAGESGLPHARLRELHRWLASQAAGGITTVAVPLRAGSGDTLIEARSRLWQLEPWLPGVADFAAQPIDVRLRAAFTELARWHAAERYVPTSDGTAWFGTRVDVPPAVTERREKLVRLKGAARTREGEAPAEPLGQNDDRCIRNAGALVARVAPRVAAELAEFAAIHLPLHSCLRDVWHDHVLFTGDAVTGIIDPSAARTEHVASDLSRLLGSFLGDAFERWETALDAYAVIRPLSAVERKLIRVLDRSSIVLSVAHWLERASQAPLAAREQVRLQAIVARLESLNACDG
ncbi:MAG: phosphotransferase [Planctomycetaceae bacterium]